MAVGEVVDKVRATLRQERNERADRKRRRRTEGEAGATSESAFATEAEP